MVPADGKSGAVVRSQEAGRAGRWSEVGEADGGDFIADDLLLAGGSTDVAAAVGVVGEIEVGIDDHHGEK